MHILFLTDNFPPEVNAPATRTYEHCKHWINLGHSVTVITGAPNFPKGKVFDGYKNYLYKSCVIDGIRVVRCVTYISANEGFLKRTLDYISFMFSSFVCGLFVKNVDVIIGTSPQFFTVCSAYMLSVFKRKPWVFELRDIWPESIKAVGAIKSNILLYILESMERYLYSKAELIIAVTDTFKKNLVGRGVDESKIYVITNGVNLDCYHPCEKDKSLIRDYNLEGCFTVGYIGTHGLAHDLDTVLDAAKILQNSRTPNNFRFVLLGDGAMKPSLQARAKRENINNVIFIDTVSKNEVVKFWSILDISLIHLKKCELFESVIPSKLFESIAMGIPVLFGVKGESAKIVNDNEVGVCFEPSNPSELCNKLQWLYDNKERYMMYSNNGPLAAISYNRQNLANRMISIIESVKYE